AGAYPRSVRPLPPAAQYRICAAADDRQQAAAGGEGFGNTGQEQRGAAPDCWRSCRPPRVSVASIPDRQRAQARGRDGLGRFIPQDLELTAYRVRVVGRERHGRSRPAAGADRLSAVTLVPLRSRAAHVVQLRSIAAVRQDGCNGSENGQKIHPRYPYAISHGACSERQFRPTDGSCGAIMWNEPGGIGRPREQRENCHGQMDLSCPGLTPQVGFTRLAALHMQNSGKHEFCGIHQKEASHPRGWIAGSSPAMTLIDQRQRVVGVTPPRSLRSPAGNWGWRARAECTACWPAAALRNKSAG